jgi:hypothetical protein
MLSTFGLQPYGLRNLFWNLSLGSWNFYIIKSDRLGDPKIIVLELQRENTGVMVHAAHLNAAYPAMDIDIADLFHA